MSMRLSTSVFLAVTAAAALISVPAVAVPGAEHRPSRPTCAEPGDREFPLRTRIHGGPAAYDAGGGFRTWYVDLTNTTEATCGNIHPVVVLVDEKRALKPEQPRLEFYDGERPRPVTFELTEQDENIGVLGSPAGTPDDSESDSESDSGGEEAVFPGFTVAPGATFSVKVRLAVTSDAVANDVVAYAAVVQRHEGGNDGDWVGQSNDYRFRILGEGENAENAEEGEKREKEGEKREKKGEKKGEEGDVGVTGDQNREGGAAAAEAVPDRLPFAEELARTGLDSPSDIVAATAATLLLLGAGLGALLAARRRR
ncbi:hypothetical protein [Streptomyces sp. NBC_00878]|uniref:hypothetical protein n=1 Tax=Streptomyces sp. NBC_00878 TaxID=2975854 RepID=UPI00224DB103|nr:hypothetical protein [Streptomyces sp. NBC_00878]MCX4908421.1 hypothetical protein [Streptomyces sp. NBC_00878]